jgi:hypothetical protein
MNMAKIQMFEATSNAVVIKGVVNGENATIIIRDGLLKEQAKMLARRLNSNAQEDAAEYKPTRREQKFKVHFEGDFEFTSYIDADEFYTNQDVIQTVRESLEDVQLVEEDYDAPKIKVSVKKLYDKQVPNL